MMRTSTLILLASVLAASASPILERQESSSFESIYKPAYESITNFSSEAFNNQQCKEAAGVETCNSWRENALTCSSTGSSGNFTTSFLNAANCLCQNSTKTLFDACATCVGSDSASQALQWHNQLCSVAPADTPATTTRKSHNPFATPTSSSSAAPSESGRSGQGSGAEKLGASLVGGIIGMGLFVLFA